jgi:hypothetical protein
MPGPIHTQNKSHPEGPGLACPLPTITHDSASGIHPGRDGNPHAAPHPHPRTHRRRQARLHLQELRLACPFGQSVQVGLQAQPRTPPSAHTNPKATLPRQLPCLTPTAALSHSPASPPLPRSRFPPHPSDHKVTGLPHQAKGLGHGWVLEQRGHRGEAATCKASQPLPLRTRTHIIGTANGHVPKHSGQSPHWFTLGDSLHWGSL